MNHEQLQDDFYRNFEGSNWHINSDHLADQCPIFRTIEELEASIHAENVREAVRANHIARQNRMIAIELGVTNDDVH